MAGRSGNLVYGRNAILEAIRAGKNFDKLFVQAGIEWDDLKEVSLSCRGTHTTIQKVPIQKLNKLTGKAHQGIIGFVSLIKYYKVNDVLMHCYEQGKSPLLLLLDGVTDIGNFGAIARSAFCFDVDAIIIPAKGSAQINAEAIKASAGALHQIKVVKVQQLDKTIQELRQTGLAVYGATGDTDNDLSIIKKKEPMAIVLGSEGSGISKDVLTALDHTFAISQSHLFDSLNVSVSAGIILHEIYKGSN